MASNTVDKIFIEVVLNAIGFKKDSDEIEKKTEKLEKGLEKTEKQSGKTSKSIADFTTGLGKAVKGVAGFAAVVAAGTGLLKLADEARKANDELNFLSKNLGMSSGEVKAWQGAAAAMGGSAQGMAGDMKGLNSSMNDFAMTGESSMLPMFNTLGVSMVDAQGKVRGTNDVMLDLADSMSKMDREQAFLMGQKLGFDEGTINTLLQGRDAMQEMVDYHKQMYTSNKQELEASRKLSENQAKLGAHWDSMKLMMGNAIIPLLVKLSNVALRFFEFLQRHQKTVKTVFEGMAIFLGMLVVPLLGKALVAALLFMAPFAPFILTVGLLAAAFIGLYNDYKVWAEGGDSLFNWGAFSGYIDNAKFSTENLGKGFLHLIGDYNSWSEVASDGKAWLKLKGFIDENGVSLKTLREGFINLASDIVKYAIPTLQGYAEIFQKLVTGDFKGAAWQAAQMFQNLGDKIIQGGKDIWNRATGAVDVATGQEVGTLSNTSILNEKSSKGEPAKTTKAHGNTLSLSEQDIVDIMKVASTEVVGSLKGGNFEKQAAGVVDTILNRTASGKYGKGVRGVANQRWAFSDINAPRKGAYGSVQNVPMSRVSPKMEKFVREYLAQRAMGRESSVGENVSYANPNYLGEASASTKAWVREVEKQAKASGQVFGAGKAIHVHGTPSADRWKMPKPFNVAMAGQSMPISMGAAQAQSAMPKNQIPASIAKPASTTNSNKVDVKVNKIEVNTTASTLTGTMEDAIKGLNNNNLYQFPIGLGT
jgi:hypothetical protein